MDVKPWDDETDMKALEASVRSVQLDGLVWGSSKLVAIGYGIKKLQITLVIGKSPRGAGPPCCAVLTPPAEDEKISLDELQETIAEFEDYVQSSDIAAMQSTHCPRDSVDDTDAGCRALAPPSAARTVARCIRKMTVELETSVYDMWDETQEKSDRKQAHK